MGLFKKVTDNAVQAAQKAMQQQTEAAQQAGMMDPAIIGGPSNKPVAADDPIWEPIQGVSLQAYAEVAVEAQGKGVNDEAGMLAIAADKGFDGASFKAAMDGWVARMGQSQAVGREFRRLIGY